MEKEKADRWYLAQSVHEIGVPEFVVSGGPFATEQHMGIYITDAKGFTVAVSCESSFADTINNLMALAHILEKVDALHVLSEAHDDGKLVCSDDDWRIVRFAFSAARMIMADIQSRFK